MKLELFIKNVGAIRKEFTWHDAKSKRLSALIYTLEERISTSQQLMHRLKLSKIRRACFLCSEERWHL